MSESIHDINDTNRNRFRKYVYTVDHKKKSMGKSQTGKICHIILLLKEDGTPKTEAEIKKEHNAIKFHQIHRNKLFDGGQDPDSPAVLALTQQLAPQLAAFGPGTAPQQAPQQAPEKEVIVQAGDIVKRIKEKTLNKLEEKMGTLFTVTKLLDTLTQPTINLVLDKGTGNTTVLFGSSKTGKSTAMLHIYKKYYNTKDWINIFTVQNPQARVYKKIKKNDIISKKWNSSIYDIEKRLNIRSKNKFNFCNFIDDMIRTKNDASMDELILTLRNSNISTVVCLQHVMHMSKAARNNVNNVILFRQNNNDGIEDAIKIYLESIFREKKWPYEGASMADMVLFYKHVTNNHGFFHVVPALNTIEVGRLTI